MAQLQTLKDRESGQTVYPITSTKAVFDERGVDLDTLLAQQKQQADDALKDYSKKTDVSQSLAGKQDKLSPTTDVYITNDNIIGLSAEFKNSKLDKSDWDARNDKFTIRGKYIYPTDGRIYSDGTFAITEFIPINRNYDIVVVAQATDNAAALALYDASHQFIGGCSTSRDTIGNVDRNTETNTYTLHATDIPARAAYFRCGTRADLQSRTYGNGPTDESRTGAISNLIADSKLELFCDLFNAAAGEYGYARITDGKFDCELNGLKLTYEEAVDIYNAGRFTESTSYGFYAQSKIRTNLPPYPGHWGAAAGSLVFYSAYRLEVANVAYGINAGTLTFASCPNLRKITGRITASGNGEANVFRNTPKLESVNIALDTSKATNLSLKESPLINLASFQTMVTNRGANATNIATITVHPDVYAKLTDEANTDWHQVMLDAAEKNINFVTP